jgi:hypothetical protein
MFTVIVPEGATTVWIRAITTEGCKYSTFITEFSAGAGEIESSGITAILGYQPQIYEPKNEQPATAEATYMWRREGTNNVWLANGNGQDYNMDDDLDGVSAPGTYYYRRYAYGRYTTGDALVPAKGTYTLVVVAPPPNDAGTTTWYDTIPKRIWTGNLNGTQAQTGCQVLTRTGYPHAYVGACYPETAVAGCFVPWMRSDVSTYVTNKVMSWVGTTYWDHAWLLEHDRDIETFNDRIFVGLRCRRTAGAASTNGWMYAGIHRDTGWFEMLDLEVYCQGTTATQRRCVALWNY